MQFLKQYDPFFHTLHFSSPNYLKDSSLPSDYQNITHDSWKDNYLIYMQVARTMQLLLDAPANSSESEITGIFFFHYDAWVDPLDFERENINNLWIPNSPDNGDGTGPSLMCMTGREKYPSFLPFSPSHNWQAKALQAVDILHLTDFPYNVNPKEWCVGWSDVYYVPRRFFVDYIFLAKIFSASQTFHEIGSFILVILHIWAKEN